MFVIKQFIVLNSRSRELNLIQIPEQTPLNLFANTSVALMSCEEKRPVALLALSVLLRVVRLYSEVSDKTAFSGIPEGSELCQWAKVHRLEALERTV